MNSRESPPKPDEYNQMVLSSGDNKQLTSSSTSQVVTSSRRTVQIVTNRTSSTSYSTSSHSSTNQLGEFPKDGNPIVKRTVTTFPVEKTIIQTSGPFSFSRMDGKMAEFPSFTNPPQIQSAITSGFPDFPDFPNSTSSTSNQRSSHREQQVTSSTTTTSTTGRTNDPFLLPDSDSSALVPSVTSSAMVAGVDRPFGGGFPNSLATMGTTMCQLGDKPSGSYKSMTVLDPDNKTVRSGQQFEASAQSTKVGENSTVTSHTTMKTSVMTSFSSSNEKDVMAVMSQMKETEQRYEEKLRYISQFADIPLYQHFTGDSNNDSILPITDAPNNRGGMLSITEIPNDEEEPATPAPSVPIISLPPEDKSPDVTPDNNKSDYRTSSPLPDPQKSSTVKPVRDTNGSAKKPATTAGTPPVQTRDLSNRLVGRGPSRTSWLEMSEVVESGATKNLSHKAIKLQESLFEVITSEASYYRSLSVLVNEFYKAPEFNCSGPSSVITAVDKHHLFSNILLIHLASEKFLNDLENRWRKDCPVITNVCDIVLDHSINNFEPYVTYLRNQTYQRDALIKLNKKEDFRTALARLQANPNCYKLHLDTFLMLPMQRLTRLRLLIETVLKIMIELPESLDKARKTEAVEAIEAVKKLLSASENERSIMDQKERIIQICATLDFAENTKRVALSGQELIKEGELKGTVDAKGSKFKISRKKSRPYYLILFNDLLLITKKKNNRYLVLDYCDRGALCIPNNQGGNLSSGKSGSLTSLTSQISMTSNVSSSSGGGSTAITADTLDQKNAFILQLVKSHNGSFSEICLFASDKAERDAWVQVLTPRSTPDDTTYFDENDCPEVVAIRPFDAEKPTEMSLRPGDVVNVGKKSAGGWYHGTKPDTTTSGWFPADTTLEVLSKHLVRRLWRRFSSATTTTSPHSSTKSLAPPELDDLDLSLSADPSPASSSPTTTLPAITHAYGGRSRISRLSVPNTHLGGGTNSPLQAVRLGFHRGSEGSISKY